MLTWPVALSTNVSSIVRSPWKEIMPLEADLRGAAHPSEIERIGGGEEVGRPALAMVILAARGGDFETVQAAARVHEGDLGQTEIAEAGRVPGGGGGVVGAGQERAAHAEGARSRALDDVRARLKVELVLGERVGEGVCPVTLDAEAQQSDADQYRPDSHD